MPTKVRLVKAMVFPVVMYGCESWIIKKAGTARRSNLSILKEISPGCSLEGLMLKLKFQYFGHLMRRADSLEKTLMLGNIEEGTAVPETSMEVASGTRRSKNPITWSAP